MQVPVLVDSEAVLEAALCHLENSVLDGIEFALNRWIIFGKVRQSAKYLQSFLLAALENQPLEKHVSLDL